jgi:hypothetical protein
MKTTVDPEEKKVWEEFDERLRMAEKRILTTGNLVRVGIPMLVDTQMRLDALIDSDARLYGRLEQLADAQKKTDEQIAKLSASVQALVDSMRGGNGNRGA